MTLRTGKHQVIVYPRIKTTDKYGETVSQLTETPTVYQCNVQPVSAEELTRLAGLGTSTVLRIKYWPQEHGNKQWIGGPYSRIVIEGRNFEQRGEALQSRMSGTTGHTKIYAVSNDSEVA